MNGWQYLKDLTSTKALSASPEVIEALHERRTNFNIVRGVNRQIAYQVEAAVAWGYSHFYENSPAVRTVVDLIANNVAQLDLRLYKEVEPDQRTEQEEHPAAESLRHPNPGVSSDQFVRFCVKSFLLYDNAFVLKLRGGGPTRAFVVLPPERVRVSGPGLQPTFYRLWNLDGTESEPIAAQDLMHWRGENFTDMRIGISKLETLRSVIVEEAAMATQMIELAKSGFAEPVWVSRPEDAPELSRDGLGRLEEHTANRLRNANKIPPVMEEGMRLEGFGINPKDAEALAVRRYALQQVATLFNVPLGMVGLADDVESARAEFYSDTLPTICEAFCRQLNRSVLVDEYSEEDLYFEFDLDEKLMGDERLKALTSAAGVPPLLRNEARARINLPPVEGGDEPITPANMTAGAKPAPNVMPIQNPQGPEQDGSGREGDPGVKPESASLTEILRKHYSRVATRDGFDLSRYNRELAEDMLGAGLNGDAEMAAAAVNASLMQALKGANGDRAAVFNRLKAEAPALAARWQMSLAELRALNVPEEMLWERAGFSPEQVDRMRALRLAEDLAGAG